MQLTKNTEPPFPNLKKIGSGGFFWVTGGDRGDRGTVLLTTFVPEVVRRTVPLSPTRHIFVIFL